MYRQRYKLASKGNKPRIASEVVAAWKSLDPPGRFLARRDPSSHDSLWYDVGEQLAVKRTIKTLGEKTQKERRAERQARGASPVALARASSAPAPAPVAMGWHPVPTAPMSDLGQRKKREYRSDSHSFGSSSEEGDKKMKAIADVKIPAELTLNAGLTHRYEQSSSSSSSSDTSHQWTTFLASFQGITNDNAPEGWQNQDTVMADDSVPLVQDGGGVRVDPTAIPTAAQLAETLFDSDEVEKSPWRN